MLYMYFILEQLKPESGPQGPPDGGWGWMVVLGSAIAHFFVVGLGRSFGVFYVDLMEIYDKSAFQTAMVVGLFNTLRMVFGKWILLIILTGC